MGTVGTVGTAIPADDCRRAWRRAGQSATTHALPQRFQTGLHGSARRTSRARLPLEGDFRRMGGAWLEQATSCL
jgi:hypothetical protein